MNPIMTMIGRLRCSKLGSNSSAPTYGNMTYMHILVTSSLAIHREQRLPMKALSKTIRDSANEHSVERESENREGSQLLLGTYKASASITSVKRLSTFASQPRATASIIRMLRVKGLILLRKSREGPPRPIPLTLLRAFLA